ncbi:hypothetical protein BaRGS_00012257, partial [Batillaria attramentaria]
LLVATNGEQCCGQTAWYGQHASQSRHGGTAVCVTNRPQCMVGQFTTVMFSAASFRIPAYVIKSFYDRLGLAQESLTSSLQLACYRANTCVRVEESGSFNHCCMKLDKQHTARQWSLGSKLRIPTEVSMSVQSDRSTVDAQSRRHITDVLDHDQSARQHQSVNHQLQHWDNHEASQASMHAEFGQLVSVVQKTYPFQDRDDTDCNLHDVRQTAALSDSLERHAEEDELQSLVTHTGDTQLHGFGHGNGVVPDSDLYSRNLDKKQPVVHKKADVTNTENFSFHPDEVPEMQVMVNSLTPVLQRRKPAQRSISHTGVHSTEDTKPDWRLMQQILGDKGVQEVPVIVHNTQEHELNHISQGKNHPLEVLPGSDGGCSSSLFVKPKFARTWHGPVHVAGVRAAPRMGTGMVTTDTSTPSGYVHTMPVISRTLLDALHKRYCSYQYSCDWAMHSTRWPDPQVAQHPLSLPLQPTAALMKKLSSDGESDTGSSAAGSSQSSPRAAHGHSNGTAGKDTTPDSSPSVMQVSRRSDN